VQNNKVEYKMRLDDREFTIFILKAINGCFISISEGNAHRLGALNVSLAGSVGTSTARVIPSKHDSVFLDMLSQRVASMLNGICIISMSINAPLATTVMKSIMNNIVAYLSDKGNAT
jgi:p-aminobenzoyl-glutamate transporter AbgT